MNMNRRLFLKVSAMGAVGVAAAGCAGGAPAAEAPAAEAPAAAAPEAAEVTLDVMSLAEYEAPYREIWNLFQSQNPEVNYHHQRWWLE